MFKSKKIEKCSIEFDKDRLVFYPGETLKGKFILNLNRSMKMSGIVAVCKGKTKTEWKKTIIDEEGNSKELEYESKSKLFEDKKKIFGDGDEDKKEHDAGEHVYDFEFELPKKLLSSFQHSLGFIQYSFKVIVKKPWKKDLKLKKMFVVNEIINANDPKYNIAPGDEDQKTLGCLCCESGPITLSSHINRSCFCPGDDILVSAKLKNNTERDMDELEAKLMQVISFEAKNEDNGLDKEHRYEEKDVAKLESKKIKGGDGLEWNSKAMNIPPLPPTMNSKLIDIKYYVRIHLDVPMGIDMNFKLPITMGTVPFLPTYQEAPGPRSDRYSPKAPKGIGYADVEFLGYPTLIPFQYSQILDDKPKKMNKKEDKEFADDTYIPVYTFARPVKGLEPDKEEKPAKNGEAGSAISIGSNDADSMPPITRE